MQFFTLAALFGAAAMAAPAPQTSDCPNPAHCQGPPDVNSYENVNFKDYTIRKNNGTLQSVSFKIDGRNATDLSCVGGPYPTLPAPIVNCGDSKYRFAMTKDINGDYPITLYHELGTAVGFWGQGVVPTYCHAGGNGPNDFVCSQVAQYTLVIAASG
ncbi:hypothetical protein J4E90_006678 [Alternaria incomplexa]|uniref:uncharacterized protein n=1 Tax=Alternaria incomplexa TaxID=1187928 RepID=UPI00221F2DBA|nr:uncharacterized protein J4E90_006678 [Alternaria incomplexa]XP_051300963.1 uncharacterized protein J4E86_007506 [Alternaria arbusti]KAI4911861.1 hypothetical protein J4E90_006678 [Alternaria incomplexa]KAI4950997.1 hypothetical protein J4E86_007506 [Alternaria arbusti]